MGRVRLLIGITAKVTDTGKEAFEKFRKSMAKIDGSYVGIGVYQEAGSYSEGNNPPTVVEVALWNEFGTRSIPERSFIRSAVDDNMSKIDQWLGELRNAVLDGKMTERKALEALGFRIQVLIQNKIKSNVPPPNAASTVKTKEQKGSAHPHDTLQDTDLLLRSITYRVFMK